MIRKTAITIALEHIEFEERIISANGFISRDLFSISDTRPTFYMIGSMGLASSIGLGIALKDPGKKVFVFDGDGNILMNLGSLTTIGSLKPKILFMWFLIILFMNQLGVSQQTLILLVLKKSQRHVIITIRLQ